DDAGQMSAWYVFSALGFYPVCPGSDQYSIGSPLVKSATINLENGKQLIVEVKNQHVENVYVEKVIVNGKLKKDKILLHSEISDGGRIIFYMSNNTGK
ncbi:MAG TPA: sugar hydrolase, partial [Bacteroidales bacterium]|nr:sugar hydrolase [Bacteroidales bacterium]